MNLSPEDALRLNVLLANEPLAIRIHEASMTVYGLTRGGEASVSLNPTGREERYLKAVKELISGHVLGSPGGYPIYLQRWTRMGQMRDESLEQLLLLGEPEAVVAAVCAPGLTDELARRAWWAMEDAENARRMLSRPAVARGQMGPVLAAYLVEHLPFETEPETMIETVRLVLQEGLLDAASLSDLWNKAQRRNAYYVGFLASRPDELPRSAQPHPSLVANAPGLTNLAEQGNVAARQLLRVLGPAGQGYLETVERVLKKAPNQDVLITLFDVVRGYFVSVRPAGEVDLELDALRDEAQAWVAGEEPDVVAIRREAPELVELLAIARMLSGLGYGVVRPVLKGTTASGSLMRRKLEPILTPLLRDIRRLHAG